MSVLQTVARTLFREQFSQASAQIGELRTETEALQQTVEHYRESCASLKAQLNSGWMTPGALPGREPLRLESREMASVARDLYLNSPLIRRGVESQVNYVFGQGVNVDAPDAAINDVLQAFRDDEDNAVEITGQTAMQAKERELQLDGNMFLAVFVDRVTGRVKVGSIPENQIEEIHCDPDNAKKVRYYKRTWTQRTLNIATGVEETATETRYYPDWRYNPRPAAKVFTVGAWRVDWEMRVYHVKTGGFSDWRFGYSEITAAIAWMVEYEKFLKSRAKVAENLSHISTVAKTEGGKEGVASTGKAVTTSYAKVGQGTISAALTDASNAGRTAVFSEGKEYESVNVKGATIHPDEGRRFLLMVCAAFGFPETFWGDVSVGTLATAESLDRPTELNMSARQIFWLIILRNLYGFALLWAVKAPRGPLSSMGHIETDADGTERVVWNANTDATVNIQFPEVVMLNKSTQITDIVAAAAKLPNGRLVASMLLNALGVDDIDAELDKMFEEDGQPLHPEPTQPDPNATNPDAKTNPHGTAKTG